MIGWNLCGLGKDTGFRVDSHLVNSVVNAWGSRVFVRRYTVYYSFMPISYIFFVALETLPQNMSCRTSFPVFCPARWPRCVRPPPSCAPRDISRRWIFVPLPKRRNRWRSWPRQMGWWVDGWGNGGWWLMVVGLKDMGLANWKTLLL